VPAPQTVLTILIIRHGEGPQDPHDPHLSPAGVARAVMLAREIPLLFPNLAAMFATAPSPNSNRPFETLLPLKDKSGLQICNKFADDEHALLVSQIMSNFDRYLGKAVLICWHHEKIIKMAQIDFQQPEASGEWPGDLYNQIWQIDYSSKTEAVFWTYEQPPVTS